MLAPATKTTPPCGIITHAQTSSRPMQNSFLFPLIYKLLLNLGTRLTYMTLCYNILTFPITSYMHSLIIIVAMKNTRASDSPPPSKTWQQDIITFMINNFIILWCHRSWFISKNGTKPLFNIRNVHLFSNSIIRNLNSILYR